MKKSIVNKQKAELLHAGDQDEELIDFEDENQSILGESMWSSQFTQL